MPWTAADIPDQTGRTFVVTGANSGLGLETTKGLAAANAHVVMACRNQDKAKDAMAEVREAVPNASLELRALDLGDLSSVADCAHGILADHDTIDVLINNAGVMAIPRRETADGFEMQIGTNHFGHYAFTGRLFQRLTQTPGARIVTVSSTAHKMGTLTKDDLMREQRYERWSVYAQSKLANLLFTYALARRVKDKRLAITIAAAHPGYAATDLQFVGPRMQGSAVMRWLSAAANAVLAQDATKGAEPELYAATMPDVETGDYLGPDGFQEMWGHPTKVQSHARSHDEADQEWLWEKSVALTGVVFPGL